MATAFESINGNAVGLSGQRYGDWAGSNLAQRMPSSRELHTKLIQKLIQRQSVVLAAVLMAALASAPTRAETTSVNNGSNSAMITQSGDPSEAEKQVKTGPDYTSIEQHRAATRR
jgi:hypothetical protein